MKTLNFEETINYLKLNTDTFDYKVKTLNTLNELVHRYSSLLVNHYAEATSYSVDINIDEWNLANSNITFETLLKDKSNDIIMKISLSTNKYFHKHTENEDKRYYGRS